MSILNNPPKLLPGPGLLHELMSWQSGNSPALEFLGPEENHPHAEKLWKASYSQLKCYVDSLARQLHRVLASSPEGDYLGGKQPIIPVLLPQSPGLYISQLAALQIGAAFCPINGDAPKERVKFICGDVDAKVVIAMRSDHERVRWTKEEETTVVWVDDYFTIPSEEEVSASSIASRLAEAESITQETSVHDDGAAVAKKLRIAKTTDLAYIMYTSGSTGLPKGVGVSHLAVTQSLFAHDLFLPPFERFLQFAAPSFDVSVFEIFFPLFKGKTLVGCQRHRLLNDLPGMINRLEVDGCELTPTVVNSLLGKRSAVPELKLLLTIGEMLTRPVVDEFGYDTKAGRPGLLYGMYGPTEAAIHCTANCMMAAGSKVGNIGVPFESVSCFIAAIPEEGQTSSEIKVLQLGEVGELILGGPQLADGYLNREKENKAAFMTYQGERAYRTGDKGRMLSDGTIEVMGRISAGQVKLRGQRVELGEIEEVVYKQKGIKMAFASVLQGMLIVFASTRGEHVSLDDLNATCEKWLPKYMVPSELVVMQEFPYLPSGKINKKQLEADYLARRTEEDGKEEEITATEKTILEVVKELLGLKVKLDKRLATYGLDSLMAIRLASQLKSKGLKITAVEILSAETISAIASVCEANTSLTTAETAEQSSFDFSSLDEPVWNALESFGIEDLSEEIFPCTPLQDAMLMETAADSHAYQNFISLRLDGAYTEGQLRDAIQKWADQNPILKTGFVDIKSEWSAYTQFVLQMLPESQIWVGSESRNEASSQVSILRPLLIQICQGDCETTLDIHIHHALYDGWSLELLIADLNAILDNPEAELVERPSFRNVVEHQLHLKEKDLSEETQYWSDHLSSLSPAALPNFNSSTSVPAGLARMSLSTGISTSKLEETARSLEVSAQSLVQAAYSVLLAAYLGKSDICFGTVFSGRTGGVDNIESICGPTLSTLPIRIDTATTPLMSSLAQSLNSVVRKHLENDVLPLRAIKKLTDAETAGRALFNTLVIWQQTLETASSADAKRLVELLKSEDQLEFALTLEVTPGTEVLKFDVTYQTNVLPERQVRLLMRQIEGLVGGIIEMPELAVEGVAEKLGNELLSFANPEPKTIETPQTLAAAVEGMAVSSPGKAAIEFVNINESGEYETESATYKQLNERANQIAHYLRSQDVKADQLVAICMDKSIALYVSILAVIKAGAGYLPLTADTPVERIQTIVKDAGVNICLTTATTTSYLNSNTGPRIVEVDSLDTSALSAENPALVSTPENLAYAVFTSGSTGAPKGVLVNQAPVLANLETLKSVYPHSEATRLLQSCSQGFDVSVFEIFWTWAVGGTLVSGTKNTIFSDIEKLVNDRGITHLSLTNTVAALIDPSKVPSVEVLIQAGEAMTGKVFNAWAGLKDKRLFNAYGPSETINVVTATAPIRPDSILSSIGTPLDTVSTFVLASNEDKDPADFIVLPAGAEGELCFGGPQVARGYLDESQNVGKFITHPKYGRIYRTGDYGRMLPDGQIIYSGRKDDQVKIRGQRVELGEISKTLLSSEAVDDCTTLVIEGEKEEDRRLVTFFTLKSESKTNNFDVLDAKKDVQESMFDMLIGGLPIYMVPSALIPVSTIPSTHVGKVDKKLLKKAFSSMNIEQMNAFSNSTEAARIDYEYNDLESQIANFVAEVAKLDIKSVAPNASFFALGIDSISAISLVRLLRETGLKVEISDVLKHSSVLRLAKVISSQKAKIKTVMESPTMLPTPEESTFDPEFLEATIDALEKQGRKVEQVLPCTPLQEAMLSASELSSEGGAYKNQVTLDLRVSVEQTESAWKEMVKRHEILRTVFVKSGHAKFAYSQVVLTAYEHKSRLVEAPSVAAAVSMAQEKDAEEKIKGELLPPYTLLYVPQPWDGKTKLVLSMHHALYDGFAMSVLYDEIEKYLSGQQLHAAPSFAPFLRYMTGVDEAKSDAHWSSLLKDFSPVPFTTPKEAEKQSHRLSAPLNASLSTIEKQLKQHSTTLLSAVQAAWLATLAQSTMMTDIVFGNVVSGRTVPVPGLNELVAPCFNTIPFRLNNIHKLSFLEAFRQFQAQSVEALPYQLTALRRIQSLAYTEGKPLFDSLVLLQTSSSPLDANIWSVEEDEGSMDLPVVVEIVPHPDTDGLSVTVHINDLPLGEEAAQDVLNTFQTFLTKALENPRQQIIASSTDKHTFSANTLALRNKKSSTTDGAEGDKTWATTEEKVRDVIAKFTTVPKEAIKKSTSIYKLGLDSINAVQVATLLRKEGWIVAASDVLQFPNIAALAGHIDSLSSPQGIEKVVEFDFAAFEHKHKKDVLAKIGKKEDEVVEVNPCTAVQSGMLAQTLHSGGKEYVNSFCMELDSSTDVQKIKSAWEAVAKACEMLRTGFVGVDDQQYPFAMVTYKGLSLPWKEVDAQVSLRDVIMDHKALEQAPWMLEHFKRDDRDVIRFTAHHALYDAASLQLFLSDIQAAYKGHTTAPYTPLRSVLGKVLSANRGKQEEAKKFWTEEMTIHPHRFPDLTPLRVTSTKSFAKTATSKLSLTQIEELAKQQGVSVQAAGQAAWGRLLSMYTGEPSVTFGVTLSGKSIVGSAEGDRFAFPTIVTLPVSCDVVGNNKTLLDASMKGNAGLSKWQFTSLTSIARWSGVEGAMFDTLFAYQKTAGEFDDEEKKLWKVTDEDASADYAVSIEMLPTRDGRLELCVTAKENVVPREQAELMIKQFDELFVDTLRNEKGAADTLAVEVKKEKILSITPPAQPNMGSEHMLLHDFVSRSASMYPNKTALEFTTCLEPLNSRLWSFSEMEGEANKIANLLQKLNVAQGQLVAICFDKCPEASWSIIGILKAGCAYVALDPGAPGDRVKFIMEDSKATIVLSSGKPAKNFTEIFADEPNVCVIDLGNCPELALCSITSPKLSRAISPQDTSYCLYTSGTTGTPKGCELSHENAVQAMYAFTYLFGDKTTENSKWLQFASFHFDVSVLEQFFAWMHGFCLTSAPRDLIFEDIPLAINVLGVTHLDLTPSLARLLTPEMVPGLAKGMFITGGEALRQDILDTWGEVGAVYNGYGPTEATIGCTMFPRCPVNGKPANIGPQFQNVGSFVIKKETDEPVLRGAVGELVVSGKLVGKGYLNRPELTQERFPTMLGERVYRTGDLVRITHDGTFLFLGRADDQVKLRGQRLELSEITEVIKKGVDGIEEVVTLVLKHEKQMKEQLVAFFVPATAGAEKPMELIGLAKQACVERLPGYMVPTHFVPLEKLPLSANNKADGKQLAAIYNKLSIDGLQKLSSAGQSARAWSKEEMQIVDILAECMNLPIDDLKMGINIFELGYDSISVIGLSQKLQSAGFANAKLATVMKNSAIEALVKVLLGDSANGEEKSAGCDLLTAQQKIKAFAHRHLSAVAEELSVDASQIENLAPCTAAQEGMVFRFLDSEEALYFSTFEFELNENVDVEKLESAWKTVASRLEVLRMKFVMTDAGIAQVVLKETALPFTIGKETADFDKMEKIEALANPWKVAILNEENLMKLDIFHGLYDGVALPLLIHQVANAYSGKEVNAGPSFLSCLSHGPLAIDEGAKEFWAKTLENAQHTPLPQPGSVEKRDVILSKTLQDFSHLETLRQTLGVTYQAIVQAAWTVTLQNYLQSSSAPTFGVVVSGRSIDFLDAEKIVGPLLNTLVFHAATEQGMTWEDLIKKCHEYNTSVLPYQHTALKDVMKWAGDGEDLIDSLFVFQHAEHEEENGIWREIEGDPTADYPIAFEATLQPSGGLGLTIVGQSAHLNREVAEKLVKDVEESLLGLKNADQKITLPTSSGTAVTRIRKDAANQDIVTDEDFEWTSTSETIRTEIASLTKVDAAQIQPFTTLFSLGLDSIDMIKLASRLKGKKIKISVSALVKAGCIGKMIKNITSADAAPIKVAIKLEDVETKLKAALEKENKITDAEDIEAVLPATPLQEGMVAEMIASDFERYYNHELYKLSSETDMEKIKSAWETCIAAHPVLRTQFVEVEDVSMDIGYAQVVRKYEPGIWQTVDLESTDSLEVVMRREIVNAITAAKQRKMIQLRAVTHGEDKYYLLSISHALYDGWSLDALHTDIVAAYNNQDITRPSPRNTLEQVINANGPEAAKYWKTALTGLPRSSFPIKNVDSTAVNRAERFSALKLTELQSFCRQSNISLQTLGQTAWALLLASYLQNLDVAFGVVLSCRDEEEARRVVMPLMNTVAVRTVLTGTGSEMLAESQDYSNKMREFQHFPLRKAQALAAQQNGGGALFDTLFIFQGGKGDGEKASTVGRDGEKKLYEPVESKSEIEFAVCVEMEIQGGELLWRTACKHGACDENETKELLEKLDELIQTLVHKKDEEVMKSGVDGISICGLPAFKMPHQVMTSLVQNPIAKRANTPWTYNEKVIRGVLSKVSKTEEEDITKETSIFHLGLDSISAIKLASLLRRQGLHIGVNEIIKNPTVQGIATIIEERIIESATMDNKPAIDVEKTLQESLAHINHADLLKSADIIDSDVENIFPLTAGQLYMAERFTRSHGSVFSATFQWSTAVKFKLDTERLNQAWQSVQARHPVLRSKIVLGVEKVGGVQIVTKPNFLGKCVVYGQEVEAVDFLDPVRISVAGGGDKMKTVKLEILHVLYDGTSLDRVLADLQTLYHDPTADLPSSVIEASAQWKYFVASTLPPSVKDHQEKFWKSYLPTVKQQRTPLESNGKSGKVEVFEPAVEIGDVKAKARAASVSVDAYVLAAVGRVWASHSGLGLGVYMSNRSSDATANLAGPTLNLLPLRVPVTEGAINSKLEEAAKQVQNDLGKLGDEAISKTRLEDIFKWTGQSVGCWVNLLKNGEGSTDDVATSNDPTKLLSSSLNTNQMLRPRAEVKEGASAEDTEEVNPYGKAVDIELRVVNDGRGLDVGVFADEEILSLDDAEQIVETLQLVLGGN